MLLYVSVSVPDLLAVVVFPFLIARCFFRVRTWILYVPSLSQRDLIVVGACEYHEIEY